MIQTCATGTVHNGQCSDDSEGGWDLVAAAQRGDRDAYARLYQRYADKVSGVVLARTGDRLLAQDLTSETFLRGWRRIDSVSDQGHDVGAWFNTIARNLVLDHWKSSRYQRETVTGDIRDSDTDHDSPEQAVIRRETADEVRRYVDALPADQQECIRLRFLQDLSVAETAAVMGRSDGAVKALQHRGVGGLRAAMAVPRADDAWPAGRHRGTGPADPLAQARRAVAEVAHHVAGADQRSVEDARAQQLARWHAVDHTTSGEVDGVALGAAAGEGRGVA